MNKVLICGGREWNNWKVMHARMAELPADTVVVHGACRGADLMADWLAKHRLGLKVKPYPADWSRHHKAAGPIRNRKMYNIEKPALVIAFHDDLPKSKGTKDMVEYALSKGTTCELISETERRIIKPEGLFS